MVSALLKQTAATFGPDLQSLLGALPQEQSQLIMTAIN